jgi:hypothetical protein
MKTGKKLYEKTFFVLAGLLIFAGGCSQRAAPELQSAAGLYRGKAAAPQAAMALDAAWAGSGYNSGGNALAEEAAADLSGPAEPAAGAVPGADAALSRKLVHRASISIRVQEPEKADAALTALMEQFGAYASSVNIRENSRRYTIRVPAASYQALLSALDGMGRLLHRSESAEDVSLRYYDLEGRLATKRELLRTYRSYLGKAENIEEILAVEAKIAELEDDIDGTGKELRSLAGMVDYATVDLEIQGPENTVSYAAPTLGERIAGLFGSFGGFLSTALVILLGLVVYGVPSLLILALLFWVLFGRIGVIKRLWRLAAGKKAAGKAARTVAREDE